MPIHTHQTRIHVTETQDQLLQACASLLSKVTRKLFAVVAAKKDTPSLKSTFLRCYGITARQFNACRVKVRGMRESVRQLNIQRIKDLKESIKKAQKTIDRLEKRKDPKVYFKKLRVRRLQNKLNKLKKDQEKNTIRICFGSRKLFRAQFTQERTHAEWKQEWEQTRNKEFFLLGSKDETTGNQTCTATIADDGSLTLRLRLPDGLNQGKYIVFTKVRFSYGHETVVAALEDCRLRNELAAQKNPLYKNHGQAISYRFVKDEKGWRVFASTSLPMPNWVTDKRRGCIGVDINTDHLAVVETDRFGNHIESESIPLCLYGKSHHQAKAMIGDACVRLIEKAASAGKPLIVERLDFTQKKKDLKELRPRTARLLSSFAYSSILQMLRSRSYRKGVELFDVDPSFTSVIGRVKFAKRYGLTVHQAAALCIARRFLKFSEIIPLKSSVPDGKGGHISFSVPVRNRKKQDKHYLKTVAQKLQAALAERFRVTICQSTDPPLDGKCDEKSSKTVGAIPTREPLAELLG